MRLNNSHLHQFKTSQPIPRSSSTQIKRSFAGLGILSMVLATMATPTIAGSPSQADSARIATASFGQLSESDKAQILSEHNQYRKAAKVSLLTWSPKLEQDAQHWANYLASIGGRQLIHASWENRQGQGENLWMGSAGYFSPTSKVQTWGDEQKHFKAGVFPNVSKTGDWSSVGHFTQIVWKNTTEVGCAQVTAGGNDILVCRYDPTGNVTGQQVF